MGLGFEPVALPVSMDRGGGGSTGAGSVRRVAAGLFSLSLSRFFSLRRLTSFWSFGVDAERRGPRVVAIGERERESGAGIVENGKRVCAQCLPFA